MLAAIAIGALVFVGSIGWVGWALARAAALGDRQLEETRHG